MSKRKVYLNWANSVLAEIQQEVEGISSLQAGEVLCQLIDILHPEACLLQKLQALGPTQLPEMYIQTALDHMRKYGIKLNFSSQDIADGDIKSMLDVLWLIILNYGIHDIRRNAHQRSVGIGKKLLLDWCQRQLDTDFDSRNTLTYNLCTGDWFNKLLKKFASGSDVITEDRLEQLKILLDLIEKQYSIQSSIINPSDIIDGTVDEHTLMIYVSLLQRKVGGSNLAEEESSKSDSRKEETSDWFSTSNGSGSDPQLSKLPVESERILSKTITDTISNRFHDDDRMSSGSTYNSREQLHDETVQSHEMNGNYEPKGRTKLVSDSVRSSSPLRRPRDHKTIMAEAKERLDEQRRRREEEDQKVREKEQKLKEEEVKKKEPAKSSIEDMEEITREDKTSYSNYPQTYMPGLGKGVPIFVVPGQNPETMFLLQALRQARQEANIHDQDSSSKSSLEETLPKSKLLDLDSIDDIPPSEYLQFEKDQKTEMSTPRGASPRRSEYVPSPEFQPAKKSIIDVVGNPPEPQTNLVDMPRSDEGRQFPRVGIKEDVKVRIEKERDRSDDRLSPRRDKSPRPLSPGYDYIEDTISINDKDTVPKTILKKSSTYGSRENSYDRSRSPRSPRDRVERDRSISNDRLTSGRSLSPRSPRSPRQRSSDLDRLNDNYSRIQSSEQNRDTVPGRNSESSDPNQRLTKVFHQELELLRMKMDMLEKSNLSDDGELEDLNSLTQRLSEKIKERLSRRSMSPRSTRSPRQRSNSPDYSRGRMFRRKGDDNSESRSLSENRVSASSDWRTLPSERSHSLQDLPVNIDKSLQVNEDGKLLYSPRSQNKPISLGYSSPIRKVSDEIWGMNDQEFTGVTMVQKEKWKKLSSSRNISDGDIVELKHALGTVVAENDILQAKLRNANTDIQEKMRKTGDVLNDCRSHLSKSQAENMELRTQLEKERTRNESLEIRMRDLEKEVKDVKASKSSIEQELEDTKNLLNADRKDIPTMQSLAEERDSLVDVLGTTQSENERLREELDRAQKYAFKAQSTINDLKTIVDDARKERKQLFEEITRLQSEGHLQTITGIIKKYMDNGMYLEQVNGINIPSRSSSPVSKEKMRSASPAAKVMPRTPSPTFKDKQRSTSPTPKQRSTSPVSKARVSRSVDSAIALRSRSESTGATTPARKELDYSGSKSPRSRSMSTQRTYTDPNRSYQESSQKSYSEVRRSYDSSRLKFNEPMMTSSPVKSPFTRMNGVSVTPVINDIISDDDDDDFEDEGIEAYKYNFEDISPSVSEFREIYPHRRTRAYRNNFSIDEGRMSPSMDDNEVNRILSRQPVRLDFNDTIESYRSHSPRRDNNVSYDRSRSPGQLDVADLYEMKSPVRQQQYNFYGKDNIKRNLSRSQSPQTRFNESRNYGEKSGEINNQLFLAALNSAVHDEGHKKFYDDNDIPEKDNWREKNNRLTASYGPESTSRANNSPRPYSVRGILKNSRGSPSPLHRSILERSVSPASRTAPKKDTNKTKLANSPSSQTFGGSSKAKASSGSNPTNGFNTKLSASSAKTSHSVNGSGKPLFSAASKTGIVRNPKDLFADVSFSPTRTSSSSYQHTPFESPPPQLSEEEKRYADLLVEKYTKQLGFNTIYS